MGRFHFRVGVTWEQVGKVPVSVWSGQGGASCRLCVRVGRGGGETSMGPGGRREKPHWGRGGRNPTGAGRSGWTALGRSSPFGLQCKGMEGAQRCGVAESGAASGRGELGGSTG